MKLRAAEIIAACASPSEVLPDPLSREVHRRVAEGVKALALEDPGTGKQIHLEPRP